MAISRDDDATALVRISRLTAAHEDEENLQQFDVLDLESDDEVDYE